VRLFIDFIIVLLILGCMRNDSDKLEENNNENRNEMPSFIKMMNDFEEYLENEITK
jgi:hypothetical protein